MDKQSVLVIEDDEFFSSLLIKKINICGFNSLCAETGEKALEILKDTLPDLILLDILLPGMDGFEVLKHLNENEKTKAIPVIVLTNFGGAEQVRIAKSFLVKRYLIKATVTQEDIATEIKNILTPPSQDA